VMSRDIVDQGIPRAAISPAAWSCPVKWLRFVTAILGSHAIAASLCRRGSGADASPRGSPRSSPRSSEALRRSAGWSSPTAHRSGPRTNTSEKPFVSAPTRFEAKE